MSSAELSPLLQGSKLTLLVPTQGEGQPVPSGRAGVQRTQLQPLPRGQSAGRPQATHPRRPLTYTELIVLGLAGAVLLGFLFSGYALFYRLQLRWGIVDGMPAVPGSAGRALVPTFTPTVQADLSPAPGHTAIPGSATPQPTGPPASVRVSAPSAPRPKNA